MNKAAIKSVESFYRGDILSNFFCADNASSYSLALFNRCWCLLGATHLVRQLLIVFATVVLLCAFLYFKLWTVRLSLNLACLWVFVMYFRMWHLMTIWLLMSYAMAYGPLTDNEGYNFISSHQWRTSERLWQRAVSRLCNRSGCVPAVFTQSWNKAVISAYWCPWSRAENKINSNTWSNWK